MTDPLFSDPAMRTAQMALDGLSRRQEVIGRNIANVDTPDYQAQSVTFEDALQRAEAGTVHPLRMELTDPAHLLGTDSQTELVRIQPRQGGSTRADGNNVDIDQELSQMAETGIRYQSISQLVSQKLLLLKAIANGR